MQFGAVDDALDARIILTVMGDDGASEPVNFLIDTGFYGELTLSWDIVQRRSLRRSDDADVSLTLAGGSISDANVYVARIIWHGRIRDVQVVHLDTDPLIGMSLLRGSNLNVDAVPGGAVVISELPMRL